MSFNITEIQGDLFSCNTECLAHCVSADFVMGQGIALLFKNKFGHVADLLEQKCQVGQVAVLHIAENTHVFYLVTKQKFYNKPTYETLNLCLCNLKKELVTRNITKISIPRIGCGLDKLSWNHVKKLLENEFKNTNISISVYYL